MPRHQLIKWVNDQLANNEASDDAELRRIFAAQGLTPEECDHFLQQRDVALVGLEVTPPTSWTS